jgi:hypothetical protein
MDAPRFEDLVRPVGKQDWPDDNSEALSYDTMNVLDVTRAQIDAAEQADASERIPDAYQDPDTPDQDADNPDQGARVPYDRQEVVNKYIERIKPILENMAVEFKDMGEGALQWQTEVIIGLLELVPEQHELTFPLYLETKDLQNKLVERRRLEAEQLEESGGGGTTTSSASTIDRTPGTQARRRPWDRLVGTFMSKVDPDILKLIAHLQAVREWSVSGEVSANAFFVKSKMGLSITFGE